MYYPTNLEALAEARRQELERQARLQALLASVRPPRQSWRQRTARLLRRLGELLLRWGDRLAVRAPSGGPVPAHVEIE